MHPAHDQNTGLRVILFGYRFEDQLQVGFGINGFGGVQFTTQVFEDFFGFWRGQTV